MLLASTSILADACRGEPELSSERLAQPTSLRDAAQATGQLDQDAELAAQALMRASDSLDHHMPAHMGGAHSLIGTIWEAARQLEDFTAPDSTFLQPQHSEVVPWRSQWLCRPLTGLVRSGLAAAACIIQHTCTKADTATLVQHSLSHSSALVLRAAQLSS